MKADLSAPEAVKMSDTAPSSPHPSFGENELSRNSIPRTLSLLTLPLLTMTARSFAVYQPLEFLGSGLHSPVPSYFTDSNSITSNPAPTTMATSARLKVYQ